MPNDNPTWTEADAVALRQFLAANPNFLPQLRRYKASKEGPQTMEAAALRGARRDGADDILDGVLKMAAAEQPQEGSPFIGEG